MSICIINTIVIGGGPAGLYLCKLLEDQNKDYILIEGFKEVGGLCINVYPNKYMHDIPGLGKITGKNFILFLLQFISNKKIHVNEKYLNHSRNSDNLWVVNTDQATYIAVNLVFSTGVGLGTYNKPLIENLQLYENKQILFFPKNPLEYKDKKVLIFGGGDSALDGVESLLEVTQDITLIHRRNTFAAMEGKQALLNKITVYTPYNLTSLNGANGILQSVTITHNHNAITLEGDYVFFCYGYNTIDSNKYEVSPHNMMHNSGFFAIGGASLYDQKRDLITTNMWEAKIVCYNLL